MMQRRLMMLCVLAVLAWPGHGLAQSTPNPTLPTQKLTIVGHDGTKHDFTAEMALTPEQQETGLMFRREVPADHGMLFVWDVPHEVPMWMKNTLVPLDMVFIGADGKVIHIAENTVPQSLANISSGGAVKATLELQAGITEKLDIRVGDKVVGGGFK
jgi:uncharacterized membrane protein (UPF0127 family)